MKKAITLIALVLSVLLTMGQAPQKMSYQAVVRNAANHLVVNSPVGMQISILQGSASGTEVYREVYLPNPQTNANGLVTVEIGTGTPLAGTFGTIDWSSGPYYLKTETDPLGGTAYTITGTSQLLSVPYALHAGTVQTISETDPLFSASPASGISSSNITNWSSAYGWGNHANAGYITSNQAITLTGEVTGSGSTSIATTIAPNSVTTTKIANDAVTASKLADNSVIANKIFTGAVTETKLGTGAVTETKILDNAITTNKIANSAVTDLKIGAMAVTEPKIANGAVTEAKIGSSAVTTAKIADNAVNANKIGASAIGTSQIASGAVTMAKLNASGIPSATTFLRGDGQWATLSGMPSGVTNQTLYHDGSTWVPSSLLLNNGTEIGIGSAPQANTQLYLQRQSGNYGAGYSNICAMRNGGASATNGGTSWSNIGVDAAIKGYSFYGNGFSAAIAGTSYFDYPNSAAVIGAHSLGSIMGALGFKDANGTMWSGYFSHNIRIDGTIRIQGGSPASGRVLTSDATGNAAWMDPASYWISAGNNIYSSNSGNVGIGVTSPSRKLQVEGSSATQYSAGGSVGYFINHQTGSYDPAAVIGKTISTSDGYGIGGYFESKYKGSYAFADGGAWAGFSCGLQGHATGSAGLRYGVYGSYNVSGTGVGYALYSNGNGGYSGSWSNVSDSMFKQNIQPLDSALSLVMLLKPKTFEMRTEEYPFMNFNTGRQYGLIAQELQQVIPEVVSKGGHPGETKEEVVEYLQVDYISLIPILIQALKEQQAEIQQLKQEVKALTKNP